MSETVTVGAIKDARDWTSDDGKIKLTFYTLDIKRADGNTEEVDHSRKQGGKEPQAGEQLDVIFEDGKFRRKMKKAQTGGQGFGGKGKRDWQPESQRDPERAARILRQHSQSCAIEVCRALGVFEGGDVTSMQGHLKRWTDWFDQDVIKASQNSDQAQAHRGLSSPGGASPAPGQGSADPQYLAKLLEDAAVDVRAAHALGLFVADKFTVAQRARAEEGLKDPSLQTETVARLRTAYEKTTGELVPGVSDGADLPF